MEDVQAGLTLFRELVSCAHNLYFSEYDMVTFTPVFNNAPHEQAVYFLLTMDAMENEFAAPGMLTTQDGQFAHEWKPIVQTNSLGMM